MPRSLASAAAASLTCAISSSSSPAPTSASSSARSTISDKWSVRLIAAVAMPTAAPAPAVIATAAAPIATPSGPAAAAAASARPAISPMRPPAACAADFRRFRLSVVFLLSVPVFRSFAFVLSAAPARFFAARCAALNSLTRSLASPISFTSTVLSAIREAHV